VKGLSEVLHELWSEEVKGDRQGADEREGHRYDGFESHKGPSVAHRG
jgi:hypothetical protein